MKWRCNALIENLIRLEHFNSRFLERHIGTTIQIRPTRSNGFNELLGSYDPSDSPTWETEPLGEAIDDKNVVFVDIFDVLCRADSSPVAVAGVVVTTIELIHNKRRSISADILDLRKLWILHHLPSGIARVGSQDDRGTTCDFLGNLVRVDMVSILLRQRGWDCGELDWLATCRCQDSPISGAALISRLTKLTFLNRDNISLYAV